METYPLFISVSPVNLSLFNALFTFLIDSGIYGLIPS